MFSLPQQTSFLNTSRNTLCVFGKTDFYKRRDKTWCTLALNQAIVPIQQQRMPQSPSQTGNPPRELWLCDFFFFFSPSPIPLLSATEPAAAPALISLLQTATLTGSVAPQASAQSLWPPTSTGAKPSQHPSAAHPSVRGYRQRGRLSPPSFTPTPPPPPPAPRSHTLSTVPIIYGWLYL